jgi:hypothetical protein
LKKEYYILVKVLPIDLMTGCRIETFSIWGFLKLLKGRLDHKGLQSLHSKSVLMSDLIRYANLTRILLLE